MNEAKTFLEPLAGFALDSWARLTQRPYVPHSLTKLRNLAVAQRLSGATTAIEVGSFKGVTTKRLSRHFDQVVSIEIDPALHAIASKRCASRSNVQILLGDGADLLPQIVSRTRNCLLFLDGHFSGGETGHGDEPEPVLKELDHIAASIDNVVGVVVDDFRLFGVEGGWPRKSEVLAKLEHVFPETHWTLLIQNDQFIAVRRAA